MLRELEVPAVWDDPERAQALNRERADLEQQVERIETLERELGLSLIHISEPTRPY